MAGATDSEEMAWHRRFAAAANNRAWDLSVQSRNAAEDQEMLNAAYASAWHWTKVGTELNRMRAAMLLAEVHALLGLGHSALAYAEKMRAYFLGVQSPDWEVAFVHVVHAHAPQPPVKPRSIAPRTVWPSRRSRPFRMSENAALWPALSATCPDRKTTPDNRGRLPRLGVKGNCATSRPARRASGT